MQDLEPSHTSNSTDNVSSTTSETDSEIMDVHDGDVVEDFARRLDQIVLQQAEATQQDSDDEYSQNDMDLFGYEQLPQDDNEDDDPLSAHSDVDTHAHFIPAPIQFEANKDTDIPEDQAEFIKNVMSKLQLPTPEWAKQFGKQIQSQQFTEWSAHYLDYKGLKKFIKNLLKSVNDKPSTAVTVSATLPPGVSPEDDRSKLLQSQKAAFFFKLERELEKINNFYLQKENELKVRLRSLVDKKRILQSNGRRLTHESTSLNSLKEAFNQFEQDLNKIQKYVELNNEGFRKILKKWDKRSKSSTKELYLSRQIDIQPCFNTQVMTELADIASTNVIELNNIQDGIVTATLVQPVTPSEAIKLEFPMENTDAVVMDDLELDLVKAINGNRVSAIKEILDRMRQHPAPEDKERISRVFLHACSEGSLESAMVLLETGHVSFQYVDDINERSCLHEAAMSGQLELLKLCVNHGVNVRTADVYGRTALHYATMNGYNDCTEYLLGQGAKVNVNDHDGFTPLIYAIINGHTRCVEILLEKGASAEPHQDGHNPLSLACHYGHTDITMLLYRYGAKSAANPEGLYPLHIVAREGHVDLCKILSQEKENLDVVDKYSMWTPIFWAVSDGNVDCAKILLDAGCKVNVKDENGRTALYYAAWEGKMDCVELLIKAGCELETIQDATMQESTEAPLDENMDDLDIDTIPTLSLPPPIIPFRIYGHNYLVKKYQVQISLGYHSSKRNEAPVVLYGNTEMSSLKLIITSRPDNGMIPHSIILPLVDEREIFTFQVSNLEDFFLEFDIFPTFGSKVIGRGVALPSAFNINSTSHAIVKGANPKQTIPLFDSHLKVVGELTFEFAVIKPFHGVQLEIGGRVETYWKSTNTIAPPPMSTSLSNTDNALGGSHTGTPSMSNPASGTTVNTVPSLITASSLSGDYLRVVVQVTRDLVPVVFANWLLPVDDFDLFVSDVSYDQFRALGDRIANSIKVENVEGEGAIDYQTGNNSRIREYSGAEQPLISLEQLLKNLPKTMGVNLDIRYPMPSDLTEHGFANIADCNDYVDAILQCVYDHAHAAGLASNNNDENGPSSRSLFFSSFNPSICTALNWKQPNYAVFFNSYCGVKKVQTTRGSKRKEPNGEKVELVSEIDEDVRCTSLKEAVKFAKRTNLLGIIAEATPLVHVPSLIPNVKESGLILTTFGPANADPHNVKVQERYGVEAMVINGITRYNGTDS
ncbi:phosphate system positive regulatory protein pho81 [Umbelopsis nana]